MRGATASALSLIPVFLRESGKSQSKSSTLLEIKWDVRVMNTRVIYLNSLVSNISTAIVIIYFLKLHCCMYLEVALLITTQISEIHNNLKKKVKL